ncbi:hypothetical protein ACS0TY_032893 [Phlomoides rotata]
MAFNVGFIPDRPYESERTEQGAERWEPGSLAQVGPDLVGGSGEEQEEGGGMEDAVEVSDFLTGRVDLGFL